MDIADVMGRMAESFSVRRAFGEPYEKDGLVVIPVAFVAGGGGGGKGEGPVLEAPGQPPLPAASEAGDRPKPLGQGSGGGLGGVVMPVGAYVVSEGKVRWVPAVDATRFLLATLAVVKLAVRLRNRHGRGRRCARGAGHRVHADPAT